MDDLGELFHSTAHIFLRCSPNVGLELETEDAEISKGWFRSFKRSQPTMVTKVAIRASVSLGGSAGGPWWAHSSGSFLHPGGDCAAA